MWPPAMFPDLTACCVYFSTCHIDVVTLAHNGVRYELHGLLMYINFTPRLGSGDYSSNFACGPIATVLAGPIRGFM